MKAEKDSLIYDHFSGGAAEAAGALPPRSTIGTLNHLWRAPFILRLHPSGYAQHERAYRAHRGDRSP